MHILMKTVDYCNLIIKQNEKRMFVEMAEGLNGTAYGRNGETTALVLDKRKERQCDRFH